MFSFLTVWRGVERRSAYPLRRFIDSRGVLRSMYARLHYRMLRTSFTKRLRGIPASLRGDPTYLAFYLALEDVRIRSALHRPLWYEYSPVEVEALITSVVRCSPEAAKQTADLFRNERDVESLSDFLSSTSGPPLT